MKARDNPFATDRVEHLLDFEPEWSGANWISIFERWEALGHRAAIVGPHGSGKTTLLRTLEKHLSANNERVAHFFLNDRLPALSRENWQGLEDAVESGAVIFLDGAERLGWQAWRRFAKRVAASKVLVTQHRQTRWPTLLHARSTPALLAHLIEQVAPGWLGREEVDELFQRHRGNLRDALWECYDRADEFSGRTRCHATVAPTATLPTASAVGR